MEIMDILYIILAVILIVILVILGMYNKLVRLQNRVKRAKANIEITLNKRFDLIPNIVECVKGYSKHEKGTLTDIVSLRNEYNSQKNMSIHKAEEMNNSLTRYLALVENYPNLKANEEYMALQQKLSKIEDELEYARKYYNSEVTRYNIAIETVPSNIVASMFAFKRIDLFQIEDSKRENIKVDL